MESEPRPAFDALVAALRAAGDRRRVQCAERRALFAEVTQKAAALQATQPPQAPQHDAGAQREEQRRQLREQHQEIMRKALAACRAGHLTVTQDRDAGCRIAGPQVAHRRRAGGVTRRWP
jgi:DNA-binding protein H-NS